MITGKEYGAPLPDWSKSEKEEAKKARAALKHKIGPLAPSKADLMFERVLENDASNRRQFNELVEPDSPPKY